MPQTKSERAYHAKRFKQQQKESKAKYAKYDKKYPPYNLGDKVNTSLGKGTVSFVRNSPDEPHPYDEPKYHSSFDDPKSSQKYVNHSGIKLIKRAKK